MSADATPPLLPATEIRALRRRLLGWYAPRRRALPWRESPDSYRVWVSEVMLQQTRIAVVVPAYERFLARFPTLDALARAAEEDVLAAWSGLGYYRRARSLHRAAQVLAAAGETGFPADPERARALPGVGAYTAAAVLSIAHGRCLAAVDGNVVRVLSRLFCLGRPDSRQRPHADVAALLLDPRRPGDWNQALMELGQTVCTPRNPDCGGCPVRGHCRARAAGTVARYPQATPRRAAEVVRLAMLAVSDGAGSWLLERGVFPYLTHLWLPLTGAAESMPPGAVAVGEVRHAIVHRALRVQVLALRLSRARLRRMASAGAPGSRRVFTVEEIGAIGRSSLLTKVLRLAQGATGRSAPDQPASR